MRLGAWYPHSTSGEREAQRDSGCKVEAGDGLEGDSSVGASQGPQWAPRPGCLSLRHHVREVLVKQRGANLPGKIKIGFIMEAAFQKFLEG